MPKLALAGAIIVGLGAVAVGVDQVKKLWKETHVPTVDSSGAVVEQP
jgi:hypothetical protein